MHNLVEMRQSRRFKIKAESLYTFNPDSFERAEIVDISMGGFACYLPDSKCKAENSCCEIVWGNGNVLIAGLPLQFVSEQELQIGQSDNSVTIWRQGWRFRDISPEQEAELSSFVSSLAVT